MSAPALASVVPVAYWPETIIRVTFTHAMDLDDPNLEDPASYRIVRPAPTDEAHYILVRAADAQGTAETYDYDDQYGYEYEPYDPDGYDPAYGYYSQQTPTYVDLHCIGVPQGSGYTLQIVKPLLGANGETLPAVA